MAPSESSDAETQLVGNYVPLLLFYKKDNVGGGPIGGPGVRENREQMHPEDRSYSNLKQ